MHKETRWALVGAAVLVGLGWTAGQVVYHWQSPAQLQFDNQSAVAVTSIVFSGASGEVAPGQSARFDYRPPVPSGQMAGEASVGVRLIFADGSTASAPDIYVENASKVRIVIGADKSLTLR